MSTTIEEKVLDPKRFRNSTKPIWCPGCGDHSVLAALVDALGDLQLDPANVAVITGIGCSSRLPGYMSCYGFNSIHGRAVPIATGVKAARPEMTVVAAGGDGDGFAIGGNHPLHAVRRNLDMTYIVMDNGIYGLTKGQVSPTTPLGVRTKTTPTRRLRVARQPAGDHAGLRLELRGPGLRRRHEVHARLVRRRDQAPRLQLRQCRQPLPDLPRRDGAVQGAARDATVPDARERTTSWTGSPR